MLFFIKTILYPFKDYFLLVRKKISLKRKFPKLKTSGNVSIRNSNFGKYCYIQNATVNNSLLGDFSYVGSLSYVNYCKIGKFTCIGPNVKIGLGSHPVSEFISVHPVFYSTAAQVGTTFSDKNYFEEYENTVIGNDVWIGANVIIKGGITIADGVVIASGSVVTKNIAPYAIVGGVPAKLIRYRFTESEIDSLLKTKWWDFDIKRLKTNFKLFHNIENIDKI